MAGKLIGAVAMSAAERQRRRRAKLKAAQNSAGASATPSVTPKPQNSDRLEKPHVRPNGRFLPGVSGNPGGRPRAALDVQALAREHTPDAIATLVKALDNERLCVSAAAHLLDRGWGKPIPHLELDGTERVTSVVLNIVSTREPTNDIDKAAGIITITAGDE